jgi:hypothetical protein
MPRGSYLLSDDAGPYAVERFSCAPGPAGWRYVAAREDPVTARPLGRIDLVLDAAGRTLRLEVEAGGWQLRGGAVGDRLLWRRGEEERSERAHAFTGSSPAYAVALSRLAPGVRRLVLVADPVLATRTVDESWTQGPVEDRDGLRVVRWQADDLATGERRVLHLAGDVVLDAPGVRLLELDGPPTLTRP